jgi:hypothetical protein
MNKHVTTKSTPLVIIFTKYPLVFCRASENNQQPSTNFLSLIGRRLVECFAAGKIFNNADFISQRVIIISALPRTPIMRRSQNAASR